MIFLTVFQQKLSTGRILLLSHKQDLMFLSWSAPNCMLSAMHNFLKLYLKQCFLSNFNISLQTTFPANELPITWSQTRLAHNILAST